MKKKNLTSSVSEIKQGENLVLPSFSDQFENELSKAESLPTDGTNVVRVPFGVRQPRKQRPERSPSWVTLVLPFQPAGSPTPPPQAA